MVSLQRYTREQLKSYLLQQSSKMAMVVDGEDMDAVISECVAMLDQFLYEPRSVVFDNSCLVEKEGGTFVDVSSYRIDEICNIYYSSKSEGGYGGDTLGIGFFPWLTSLYGITFLHDLTGYLILQGNLNKLKRQLGSADDYQLMPVDADGRQLLQLRTSPELFWLDFLPWLSSTAEEWYLYEFEWLYLKTICRCELFVRNAEIIAAASPLGFGKDVESQLTYWQEKKKAETEAFTTARTLAWLG